MSYGFRKTLNTLFILVMMIFTGCGNVEEVSPESIEEEITEEVTTEEIVEEITTEISEAGNMDKILFYATISYNYQNGNHTGYTDTGVYYFVVQNDGTVWTMDTSNYSEDNYEWLTKFGHHDESAWETAKHLENIGSLSPEDTQKLSEYISAIDYDSEYYDRERDDYGIAPEVIETVYYDYYCVIPDNKSRWFGIMYA